MTTEALAILLIPFGALIVVINSFEDDSRANARQVLGIALSALGLALLILAFSEGSYRDLLACNATGSAGIERGCLRGRN